MDEIVRCLKKNLTEVIRDSSKVFIVGHNEPDFDSIGSAIGLLTICRLHGRKAYIVVNDADMHLEPGVKEIISKNRKAFNIIDMNTFKALVNKNSSVIITDTNKDYLVSIREHLPAFKHRLIVDHHAPDEHTIDAEYSFINPNVSSASEIVSEILNSYRYRYDPMVANCLLAGIELDTNHYQNNTTDKTHDVAENLIKHGADPKVVAKLFKTEFETDRRINNLVFNGTLFEKYEREIFQTRHVSFTLNREAPETIYRKEEIAKASDKMLKYRIDAAFVMGFVKEGLISISARGKNQIDVGAIMSKMNGGGNAHSAGGRITSDNILEVEEQLMQIVAESIEQIDKNAQEQPLQKIKLPI